MKIRLIVMMTLTKFCIVAVYFSILAFPEVHAGYIPPPPAPLGYRDRRLGESCNVTQDCQAAYATCTLDATGDGKTCQCPGHRGARQMCAQELHCPVGSLVLSQQGKPIECTRDALQTGSITNKCPAGSFCLSTSYTDIGHCCPNPVNLCPIGEPAADRTCETNPASPFSQAPNQCDHTTHICFAMATGVGLTCCPLPCSAGDVYKPADGIVTCAPQELHCPVGEPIQSDSGKPIACSIGGTDDCPAGSYCFGGFFFDNAGHCCPKPTELCPAGEPTPGQVCGSVQPVAPDATQCDRDISSCFSMTYALNPACCPAPCSHTDVYKAGKCYLRKKIGDNCEIDEQCGGAATCLKGTCTCIAGWANRYGYCERITCQGELPNFYKLPPQNDSKGNIVTCQLDCDCAANYYCSYDFSVCCPIPNPLCSSGVNTYEAPPSLSRCKGPADCPSQYECDVWYTHWAEPLNDTKKCTAASPPVIDYVTFCCPPVNPSG